MSGRPVQLFAAAALAAVASTAMMSTASAGCYSSCGSSYSYAAPVAYYSAPVVYSYSYAAPVRYAAPCGNPCGYSYGYGYAAAPSYVVNEGPTYSEPVTIGVAPTQSYDYGYRRAYPYYAGGGGLRWHHRRWYRHHGYGYRRSYGLRYGYGARHGYRAGIVMPGYRHGLRMRQPMVAPRYRTGLIVPPRLSGGAIPPRHWNAAVRPHRMGMPPHRMMQQHRMGGQMPMMRQPGSVDPHQKKMP